MQWKVRRRANEGSLTGFPPEALSQNVHPVCAERFPLRNTPNTTGMNRHDWLSRIAAPALVAGFFTPLAVRAATTRLRIATPPITVSAQPYFARANGLFAKAGIDADISFLPSGAAIAAAVVAGSLDIGDSNLISLATAHDRGVPIVVIAPDATFQSDHAAVLLVTTKQSPLRTAKDLEGKTVAVNGLKNLPHIATMAWIDKNGGDSSAVKFIEIPIPATQAALSSGRVDAAILNEPFLSAALQADARVFGNCYEAIAKDFTYGAFVATQQWASDHPDLVRAFRSIVYESSRWANTHVAAASEILMRDAKLDVSALKNHDAYAEKFDPSLMQPVIDASAKYGVIKASFPVSEMVARPL